MKNQWLHFFKKSFLYIVAMCAALVLSYFLGLTPVLKAQPASNSGPLDPDLTFPEQAPVITPAPVSGAANPSVPQPSPQLEPQPLKPTLPPPIVVIPNVQHPSPRVGILFRHIRSYVGELSEQDRDPFRKPMYLLELEESANRPQRVDTAGKIDEKMEAIRRWPITEYKLVGVIWDVQSPKAMIVDPSGTMHLLKRNYRIGDRDGVISSISEGSMTVVQDDVPVVISIFSKGN